jgi:hypothetical protein
MNCRQRRAGPPFSEGRLVSAWILAGAVLVRFASGVKMKPVLAVCLSSGALLFATAASAHHSFAMFDQARTVSLVGVVQEFEWTNPHAFIEIDVPGGAGPAQRWSVEMNSPNNLKRQGWSRPSLKPGDRVTCVINPLRDGKKGGLFLAVTLPDGTVLGDPAKAGQPVNVNRPGS